MAGNRHTDDPRTLDPGEPGFDPPAEDVKKNLDGTDTEHAMLRVRVSLKGRPIRSHTFDKDVITAGRDPDSDIYLDNPGISRHHLRMEKTRNGYYAEDLGSANGSYLNDEPIQKELLRNDDLIRIGKFSLWISYEEDRRAADGQDKISSPPPQQGTTVLSTSELETMMAKVRAADDKPTVPERPAVRPHPGVSKSVFVTWIIATLLLGAALGAATLWLLAR